MTAQIDRLEALLARVQENRHQPRAASPDGIAAKQVAKPAQAALGALPPPLYSAGGSYSSHGQAEVVERTAPGRLAEPRAQKPGATPLEMAVEGRLSAPAQAAVQPMMHTPAQPAMQAKAAAPAAPVSHEGVMLVDPQPPQHARAIAQVVSMNPPSQAATFGDLLRRSLSLRPR